MRDMCGIGQHEMVPSRTGIRSCGGIFDIAAKCVSSILLIIISNVNFVGCRELDLTAVERSKNFLLEGRVDYEFRTTVVRGLHTAESLMEAAAWIRGAKEYYLQQFKDSGDIIDIGSLGAFSDAEMCALAEQIRPIVPSVKLRGVNVAEKSS